MTKSRSLVLAFLVLVLLATVIVTAPGLGNLGKTKADSLPRPVPCPRCWRPPLRLTWQWQLSGRLDLRVRARMYDVDMFDTSSRQVAKLHDLGRRVVCYIDAGTWENWRPDRDHFPKSLLGRPVQGWSGEWWLDIRQLRTLHRLMLHRLKLCKAKGFDGVELDNVDAYQNDSGFPLTAADQLRYNTMLANAAHALGLSVGLKNDLGQVKRLVRYFDWALDEQCFQYQECGALAPFIRSRKSVFEVEYQLRLRQFCLKAEAMRFNAMRKRLALGPWRRACP